MNATWRRLVPATLFGRLACLLLAFALANHVLALTVLFELRPAPPAGALGYGLGDRPPSPGLTLGLLCDIGVRLAALTLAAWIAASWLSRPIKRLANAAHELGRSLGTDGRDGPCSVLPEEGPRECRDASRGFNRMQAQIQRQLAERDRFVAAVSHDLRTPLTRLGLRAEGLEDAAQQAGFRQDIAEMDRMISATLDYLRGAAAPEAAVRLDVDALAHSIAEDQAACGQAVAVVGRARPIAAQPSGLRRVLCNLIENALRYGGNAELHLRDTAEALSIEVRDRGPGIPEDQLDKVLAPVLSRRGLAQSQPRRGRARPGDRPRHRAPAWRHAGAAQRRRPGGRPDLAALKPQAACAQRRVANDHHRRLASGPSGSE